MSQSFDAIVVGLGAMGSAAAFHLARRGVRVLGLEQFDIPHNLGSSHGHSRMIRLAYYEHADYVPLLKRAYELWEELEKLSGQKLLFKTGGIYMGPADGEVVPGARGAARQYGLAHEMLSWDELRKRYPMFSLPEGYAGIYEPEAGFLLPELCISTYAAAAMNGGAELHAHEAVMDWSANSRGVTVRTSKGTYNAERVIFCGGAWTSQLLKELSAPLVVTRQILGWIGPRREAELFSLGRFPVWGIEQADQSLAYGFPILPNVPGLKLARHAAGEPTEVDTIRREIGEKDEAEIREIVDRHLPTAAGPIVGLRTCMYTNSLDGHFILDQIPGHENVLMAGGFSGHGFKFASVVGEVLAELAVDGHTRLAVGFLGLSRFRVKNG
ncbi:MAG TPA: N-methyl-L-tryptophan oxidase [Tepidisphaeraceae bacterium]|jgi:sarcosine oxidase|nr:N-methyl-L-tryptophan oxidase [Tepidisphaeraceae bacterium]